jgi:RNA polymerase sigma-70 factor (ECF subfamily)
MATQLEAFRLAANSERWIAEAHGGSRSALDRLLELCSPYLFAVAKREFSAALRSRLDPADVVQDTLLKAWQNFPSFRGAIESELLAWLRQILRHNLANERRRHMRMDLRSTRREVPLAKAAAMRQPDDAGSEAESPDMRALGEELHEVLEDALRRLPEHYRQVLRLHAQEELTFGQVAEQLGCSAEAARKLWRRAVEILVRLLGEA